MGEKTLEVKLPQDLIDIIPQERITGDILRGHGPRRGNLEALLRYWRPIMRKPGGFRRCIVILANHPELYPLQRICAWLHHETTGKWPNEGNHHGVRRGGGRAGRVLRRAIPGKRKRRRGKSDDGVEIASWRIYRRLGGMATRPIGGNQNTVEYKAARFKQGCRSVPMPGSFEWDEHYVRSPLDVVDFKWGAPRVARAHGRGGRFLSSLASFFTPGDIGKYRSPGRSLLWGTLTPGGGGLGGGGLGMGGGGLGGGGIGGGLPVIAAAEALRCPSGYLNGGRFTDPKLTNCGGVLFDAPSKGPGAVTEVDVEKMTRRFESAQAEDLPDLVRDIVINKPQGDPFAVIREAAMRPKTTPNKKRRDSSTEDVISHLSENENETRLVRRDGVVLEPTLGPEVLARVDHDSIKDAIYVTSKIPETGQMAGDEVRLLTRGAKAIVYAFPEGTVTLSRKKKLNVATASRLRTRWGGLVRHASLSHNPAEAMLRLAKEFADSLSVSTDFRNIPGANERIVVYNVSGERRIVPRWIFQTFLSLRAPRRPLGVVKPFSLVPPGEEEGGPTKSEYWRPERGRYAVSEMEQKGLSLRSNPVPWKGSINFSSVLIGEEYRKESLIDFKAAKFGRALDDPEMMVKGLLRGRMRGRRISNRARRMPKVVPYDPDAVDGEGDGLVQDGTIWERPIGTRFANLNAGARRLLVGAYLVNAQGEREDYSPGQHEASPIGERYQPKLMGARRIGARVAERGRLAGRDVIHRRDVQRGAQADFTAVEARRQLRRLNLQRRIRLMRTQPEYRARRADRLQRRGERDLDIAEERFAQARERAAERNAARQEREGRRDALQEASRARREERDKRRNARLMERLDRRTPALNLRSMSDEDLVKERRDALRRSPKQRGADGRFTGITDLSDELKDVEKELRRRGLPGPWNRKGAEIGPRERIRQVGIGLLHAGDRVRDRYELTSRKGVKDKERVVVAQELSVPVEAVEEQMTLFSIPRGISPDSGAGERRGRSDVFGTLWPEFLLSDDDDRGDLTDEEIDWLREEGVRVTSGGVIGATDNAPPRPSSIPNQMAVARGLADRAYSGLIDASDDSETVFANWMEQVKRLRRMTEKPGDLRSASESIRVDADDDIDDLVRAAGSPFDADGKMVSKSREMLMVGDLWIGGEGPVEVAEARTVEELMEAIEDNISFVAKPAELLARLEMIMGGLGRARRQLREVRPESLFNTGARRFFLDHGVPGLPDGSPPFWRDSDLIPLLKARVLQATTAEGIRDVRSAHDAALRVVSGLRTKSAEDVDGPERANIEVADARILARLVAPQLRKRLDTGKAVRLESGNEKWTFADYGVDIDEVLQRVVDGVPLRERDVTALEELVDDAFLLGRVIKSPRDPDLEFLIVDRSVDPKDIKDRPTAAGIRGATAPLKVLRTRGDKGKIEVGFSGKILARRGGGSALYGREQVAGFGWSEVGSIERAVSWSKGKGKSVVGKIDNVELDLDRPGLGTRGGLPVRVKNMGLSTVVGSHAELSLSATGVVESTLSGKDEGLVAYGMAGFRNLDSEEQMMEAIGRAVRSYRIDGPSDSQIVLNEGMADALEQLLDIHNRHDDVSFLHVHSILNDPIHLPEGHQRHPWRETGNLPTDEDVFPYSGVGEAGRYGDWWTTNAPFRDGSVRLDGEVGNWLEQARSRAFLFDTSFTEGFDAARPGEPPDPSNPNRHRFHRTPNRRPMNRRLRRGGHPGPRRDDEPSLEQIRELWRANVHMMDDKSLEMFADGVAAPAFNDGTPMSPVLGEYFRTLARESLNERRALQDSDRSRTAAEMNTTSTGYDGYDNNALVERQAGILNGFRDGDYELTDETVDGWLFYVEHFNLENELRRRRGQAPLSDGSGSEDSMHDAASRGEYIEWFDRTRRGLPLPVDPARHPEGHPDIGRTGRGLAEYLQLSESERQFIARSWADAHPDLATPWQDDLASGGQPLTEMMDWWKDWVDPKRLDEMLPLPDAEIRTEITEDDGEFRVRLFIDGEHQAGADYFAGDREEAEETAKAMEADAHISDKTTSFAQDEADDLRVERRAEAARSAQLALDKHYGRVIPSEYYDQNGREQWEYPAGLSPYDLHQMTLQDAEVLLEEINAAIRYNDLEDLGSPQMILPDRNDLRPSLRKLNNEFLEDIKIGVAGRVRRQSEDTPRSRPRSAWRMELNDPSFSREYYSRGPAAREKYVDNLPGFFLSELSRDMAEELRTGRWILEFDGGELDFRFGEDGFDVVGYSREEVLLRAKSDGIGYKKGDYLRIRVDTKDDSREERLAKKTTGLPFPPHSPIWTQFPGISDPEGYPTDRPKRLGYWYFTQHFLDKEWQKAQRLRKGEEGNVHRRKRPPLGRDYSGESLEEWNEMQLSDGSFQGADSSQADLHKLNLSGSDFSKSKFVGADLGESNMEHSDFTESDLSEVEMAQAMASYANFRKAILEGGNFNGTDFRNARFFGAKAAGADFSDAFLGEADMTSTDLRGAILAGADLTGADLFGADLTGADLTGANLRGVDLSRTILTDAILTDADGWGTIWPEGFDPVEAGADIDSPLGRWPDGGPIASGDVDPSDPAILGEGDRLLGELATGLNPDLVEALDPELKAQVYRDALDQLERNFSVERQPGSPDDEIMGALITTLRIAQGYSDAQLKAYIQQLSALDDMNIQVMDSEGNTADPRAIGFMPHFMVPPREDLGTIAQGRLRAYQQALMLNFQMKQEATSREMRRVAMRLSDEQLSRRLGKIIGLEDMIGATISDIPDFAFEDRLIVFGDEDEEYLFESRVRALVQTFNIRQNQDPFGEVQFREGNSPYSITPEGEIVEDGDMVVEGFTSVPDMSDEDRLNQPRRGGSAPDEDPTSGGLGDGGSDNAPIRGGGVSDDDSGIEDLLSGVSDIQKMEMLRNLHYNAKRVGDRTRMRQLENEMRELAERQTISLAPGRFDKGGVVSERKIVGRRRWAEAEVARQGAPQSETVGFIKGWDYAEEVIRSGPGASTSNRMENARFTEGDILEIHGHVDSGGRKEYRTTPVTFANGTEALSAELIPRAMENLMRAHKEGDLTPEEFVEEFLKIHPFEDGNGRTASILLNALEWQQKGSAGPRREHFTMLPKFFEGE